MTDDITLIDRYKQGDEKALEIILEKYKALVNKVARIFYVKGADREDLTQEGMIALYKAVITYDVQGGATFSTYATECIKNRIKDCIKSMNRLKNSPLNDSVPITSLDDKDMIELSPEELAIISEDSQDLYTQIYGRLSEEESTIFKAYLSGRTYSEISKIIGKNTKFVDNALQKIKKKIKQII